jgi:GNAT superfamily N-acetyltransferase
MEIAYTISPSVTHAQLNQLFAAAWEGHVEKAFQPILERSLLYVCAWHDDMLIGFVNVAWDGGVHAFLLDTTVHRAFQRQGIGHALVTTAIYATKQHHEIEWMHVDYEPRLSDFYAGCGFQPTHAGLINLHLLDQ